MIVVGTAVMEYRSWRSASVATSTFCMATSSLSTSRVDVQTLAHVLQVAEVKTTTSQGVCGRVKSAR